VMAYMNGIESVARVRELERALDVTTSSISWRLTAPLRLLRRSSAPPTVSAPGLGEGVAAAETP
jgi:hypothetical protein